MCNVTYIAEMHNWERLKRDKSNTLIRKVVKRTLGLPMYTSWERLLHLGVHKTLAKIAQSQERAHFTRLSITSSGRNIAKELGVHPR